MAKKSKILASGPTVVVDGIAERAILSVDIDPKSDTPYVFAVFTSSDYSPEHSVERFAPIRGRTGTPRTGICFTYASAFAVFSARVAEMLAHASYDELFPS